MGAFRAALARGELTVRSASAGADEAAADAAVSALLRCRGRRLTTGLGKSGLVAARLASSLSAIGLGAAYVHGAEWAHGELGGVGDGDVVLAVSHSGSCALWSECRPTLRARRSKPLASLGVAAELLCRWPSPQRGVTQRSPRSPRPMARVGNSPPRCASGAARSWRSRAATRRRSPGWRTSRCLAPPPPRASCSACCQRRRRSRRISSSTHSSPSARRACASPLPTCENTTPEEPSGAGWRIACRGETAYSKGRGAGYTSEVGGRHLQLLVSIRTVRLVLACCRAKNLRLLFSARSRG